MTMNDDAHNDPTRDGNPLASALDALGERDRAEAPDGLAERIAAATAHAPPLRLASDHGARRRTPHRRGPVLARIGLAGSGLAAAAALGLLALPLVRTNPAVPPSELLADNYEVAMIEAELETFLELDSRPEAASDDGGELAPIEIAGDDWVDTWIEMDEMLAADTQARDMQARDIQAGDMQ